MNLSKPQLKLLSVLLEMASEKFCNHGCNDFDLAAVMPDVADRRALMQAFEIYNGTPEEFDPDGDYEYGADYALMAYFGAIAEAACVGTEP